MSQRLINPAPQFFYNGTPAAPLSGGLMYFYVPGSTLTPKNTYSDNGLSVANSNPVVLSSSGVLPNVFLDGAYRVILKDKDGVQQWDRDSINSVSGIAGNSWDSTITYGLGGTNIVYASDGKYYVSIQANNTAHDPAAGANPLWWQLQFDYNAIGQTLVANKSVAVGNTAAGLTGVAITSGYTVIGNTAAGIAGLNTLTKGTLAVGNGTTTTALTVGSNAYVLTADSGEATGVKWAAPTVPVAVNIQEFTGSGTWTKPAGAVAVLIEMWGGGGGGAGQATGDAGGGAGGDYVVYSILASEAGATESVTIGAGGAGGTTAIGANGGNTTFGSLSTARGGDGGTLSSSQAVSGGYTGIAITSGQGRSGWSSAAGPGTQATTANAGGNSIMGGASGGGGASTTPGAGGTSLHGGNGGAGRTTAGTATAGSAKGGGGGGAYNGTGGAGGAGYARITSW